MSLTPRNAWEEADQHYYYPGKSDIWIMGEAGS